MNGVINVLKPPGMTSSDVVVALRKILNMKKIGHTGTLDPAASGVLPICLGRATKIADYIMNEEKEYIANISFGKKTDTQDSMGKVTGVCNKLVTYKDLSEVLPSFIGQTQQTPSKYSAIKIDGKKAYELARKTIDVVIPPRTIHIKNLEILYGEQNDFLIKVDCSKGTYIRALCEDIAAKLQTYAYLSFLLRSKTSSFVIEDSYTIDEVISLSQAGDYSFVKTMEDALEFMPKLTFDDYLFKIITTGSPIDLQKVELTAEFDKNYCVYCNNILVGIGKRCEDTIKIISMLYI